MCAVTLTRPPVLLRRLPVMSDGQPLRRTVYLRWLIALLSPTLLLAPAAAQGRAPVPGEVDTHVTQSTIRTTICEHGYTAKVRPPRPFTDATKRRLANGHPGSPQDYELDHLIPLGLGRHPTSSKNSGSRLGRRPRLRTGTSYGCIERSARAA